MINEQIVCNGCGILLRGKHGMVYEKKPHLSIIGRITLENLGERDHKWHMYITKEDSEETTVCNTDCLKVYLETRERLYKEYREKKLRAEASSPQANMRQASSAPAYAKRY